MMNKLFKDNIYISFMNNQINNLLLVEDFNEFFVNIDDKDLVDSLEEIVLHKSYSEMFLIVQGENALKSNSVDMFVNEWEDQIMSFINFSSCTDIIEKLRYDINLIILYEKDNEANYITKILRFEKSSRNCRKVFLPTNNGEPIDSGSNFLMNVLEHEIINEEDINEISKKMNDIIKDFEKAGIVYKCRKSSDLQNSERRLLRKWVDNYAN